MSFPAYDDYKESGIEWLGDIPKNWQVRRFDAIVKTSTDGVDAKELAGQEVFHYSIPVVQESGDGQLEHGSEISSSKLVISQPQVILSKLNPRKGTVCIAEPKEVLTVCSGEFVPLIPREIELKYLFYLVQTDNYRMRLESLVESATRSHQRVLPSRIVKAHWAFPSIFEQRAIASFLDVETSKIDALVSEQRRLIELLKEKRQAVISHAVTKGLNPNAPMKPSGIQWLGDVPEHWSVVKLKRVAFVRTGVAKGKDHGDKKTIRVPYLRVANVQDGYLDLAEVSEIDILEHELDRYRLRSGDVLMNEGGDYDKLGRGHIWEGQIDPCITQNHVFAVRPTGVASQWLNRITSSDYAQFYFMGQSKQSTNLASISSSNLMNLPIIVPPENEQHEIIDFIRVSTGKFDRLLAEAERAITLLQERRTALISAAVTGKIDVRGFTATESVL